jgi:superfamily II DNA or RNA helicase
MSFIHPSERSRILEYLRSLASTSAVEQGLELATSGAVVECSRASHTIQGAVKQDTSDEAISLSLRVISARRIEARCSCELAQTQASTQASQSSESPLTDGEWCPHAVALLWRAHELGFLSEDGGFARPEATLGISGTRHGHLSGTDYATAIRDLSVRDLARNPDSSFFPQVGITLDVVTDRLGVQITFDGEIQEPAVFESFRRHSARTLDNLLVRIVDEEGVWDEEQRRWYVNSSDGIGLVLGLLNEYASVSLAGNSAGRVAGRGKETVRFSPDLLNARLSLRWSQSGADLGMEWVLPDGSLPAREHDLIGNGPHWTLVQDTIYRLSSEGSKIAALFPHGPAHTLSQSQVGPLLEVIQAGLHRGAFVTILNPENQPACEQRRPEVVLKLERRDDLLSSTPTSDELEVGAALEFVYPQPEPGERVVFLPDRAFEKECHDLLVGRSFEFNRERKRYALRGSKALDAIFDATSLFPESWQVVGMEQLRRGVRFVDSTINVSLAGNGTDFVAKGSERGGKARGKAKEPIFEPPSKSGIDWFDCHISLVLNNSNVPISTLFKSHASDDDRWIKLDSGAYTSVPGGSIRQLKGMLGMLDPNFKLSNSIKTKLSTPLAIGMSRMQGSQFAIALDPTLQALASRLDDFSGITPLKVSKSFTGKLRPYQQDGVNWLNFLDEFEFGGILADEMGLGKTVQTLAFLQTVKEQVGKTKAKTSRKLKPALVIAPTSVMMNWWYEAQRFTPKLKVVVLHGAKRKALLQNLKEYDLVITSYALLRVDRFELERQEFSHLILDEAQHIKNYQAATTQAAKGIRADRRIALTGTPTENRPLELWSLMDFLMPGYLGTHDFFRSHIERPIMEHGGSIDVARLLRGKTRPFIFRRTKAEVERDLPPKTETVLHVEMAPSQKELYAHILEEVRPRVFDAVEQKGIAGASVSILAALLRLRQVCNHPNSIEALKSLSGYESGKFNLLKDLLQEALEAGRKILLFGQFREMLAIIRRHLEETQVKYVYLDGATRDRQKAIDEFNNDPSVRLFLISLKAGGLGLNLTAADTVIIYDPWWNPAVESQAIDRAHRIGQDKPVHVYRLVTEDSVEQKIMELKRKKTALIEALVNDTGLSSLALTKADLESLFTPMKVDDSPVS